MEIKHAIVKQVQGITFVAKGDSNHWATIDGPESLHGNDAGPRPKELLLFALGGCTGSDVISILTKKRVPFTNMEIRLAGTVRDEHPQVFTDIHIEYIVDGDEINPADVERAIELSTTKYCPIIAMLKGSVTITHSYRIVSMKTRELVLEHS